VSEFLEKLAICIEFGKINKQSPYPVNMKDEDGASEIAAEALKKGIKPDEILESCTLGMERIGEKFSQNKVFVPELLMAAKAMSAVMEHLKPFFKTGEVKRKGLFVIGTVTGDLHDIGKNLVAMSVEGAGWEVVDLGVDVSPDKFLDAVKEHPGCSLGLSALLTTTMVNMEDVIVGGAPVTQDFCDKIGADFYSSDPQGAVRYLNESI
jgi:methanogenic corrinoid protein MtbC1